MGSAQVNHSGRGLRRQLDWVLRHGCTCAVSGFEGESLEQGPSNRRLGHRFETCVSAWFQHHPEWDIKAANHVVQLGKRTAGEIDLLVERAGEVLHLELAVKFYLSTSGSAQWDTWVGVILSIAWISNWTNSKHRSPSVRSPKSPHTSNSLAGRWTNEACG